VSVRRPARRTALGVLAGSVALSLGATVALAAGVSGDPAALALYRSAVRATNALPAYVQLQSGYVQISDSLGPTRVVHWAWGWDQFQPGFHPATERIVIVQHAGRVAWIEDTLSASSKGCHSPRCRKALPIELLITPTKDFDGLISSGSSASCFVAVSANHIPYSAGVPWWSTVGNYQPLQPHGLLTEVTSTYHSGGQELTESDWITNSTKRFDKSVFRIAKGHGHPGFSFRNADDPLAATPHFPAFSLCPPSKAS
jgi:hypothetical protein